MKETRSTCPYCGVGCGVIIESSGDRITGVRGDLTHPANFGRLCTKGSTLHLTASEDIARQTRLLQPMRRSARGAMPNAVSWDVALDEAADRFAQIIDRDGPDAVGFYLSGQLLTEDYYVFNKLAKGLIGTNNVDTNSRLCMSSAVAGYKQTLGADAPPVCFEDIDHAQCLFITGSNTAWAHPILFRRIEQAKAANPRMKIIVCDPRRTDTVEIADLHLPLQPGTDVMLYLGMLHIMLAEDWTQPEWIAAHTTGFEALKNAARDCTPARTAQICQLRTEDLLTAAHWFATAEATLSLYCQGLNQSSSGTAKNTALINLHLATAQIGRPGAGPFSLTGQPNAMGGREVGGMANLLSAHRDLGNAAHRAEVAELWGIPEIPAQAGKTAVEMFQACADGEIKALWIACTNPAQSLPDQSTVRRALERAEFVVLQEAYLTTATASYADLLLPATSWGEKTGTVTNSERRISRVRPAVAAPGQTRHDWRIAIDFAHRLEARLGTRRVDGTTLFPYESEESIWNEHRDTTRGRDLDITGLSYGLLERLGPQQWPMPQGASQGRARLYTDGVFATSGGRARFRAVGFAPPAEPRDARYPFSLTTGRLRDQWHGMSRTGTLGQLFGHAPEPVIQMHAGDLDRHALQNGDLVHVTSRHGRIVLPVQASDDMGPSLAFIAMHWGEEYLSGCAEDGRPVSGINAIMTPAFCPDSKQPELKHAAVSITKAELPWKLLGLAWMPSDTALAAREALKPLMTRFPFSACVPFSSRGAGRTGVLFRAAARQAPPEDLLAEIEQRLGIAARDALRYADPRQGQYRCARLTRHGEQARLEGVLLAGDTRAESWIKSLLQDELAVQAYGRLLLMPSTTPPLAMAARGKTVCTCFGVDDASITLHLTQNRGDEAARLAALQTDLKCGTNCGSCLPELRRLVRATPTIELSSPFPA